MLNKTTDGGGRVCAFKIPQLTELVDATDKIAEAFGSSDPIDVAIRRDAYKLYDISFGIRTGTTQQIYGLRQTEKRWAA